MHSFPKKEEGKGMEGMEGMEGNGKE